jgi:hypothetical protein
VPARDLKKDMPQRSTRSEKDRSNNEYHSRFAVRFVKIGEPVQTRAMPWTGSHHRRCCEGWRWLPIAGGYLGRHHHAARPVDADLLGGLAEFERELIKAQTDEGKKRAKVAGVRFGRKLKLTPHQRREALARREAGEALAEIARSYAVGHSTISRLGSAT